MCRVYKVQPRSKAAREHRRSTACCIPYATLTIQGDVCSVSAPASGATSPAPGIAELPVRIRQFLAREHKLLIGGEWVDAADGTTFETVNPDGLPGALR